MSQDARHCGGCGEDLPLGAAFCPSCGAKAAPSCIACGADLPANARFCPQCGVRQMLDPVEAPQKTLSRDGERRQITVMFCDVVGSTRLSTEIDPEDLREILRAFQTEAAAVIEAAGGLVARYMGDGILAYFGYPTALEDAPKRAASAGLEILRRIDALNHGDLKTYGVTIALRIGIHTGVVIVSEMGAGKTREAHSVVGEAPNIAAFVETCAAPNTVLVSSVTAGLIRQAFRLESIGLHSGKGLNNPVELFRIAGPKAGGDHGRPVPSSGMIGREPELATLHAAWRETCETGRMQIVRVTGEPGIGKSGLTAQFLHEVDIPRQRLVRLYGSREERDSAFVAVLRLVTNWLADDPTDDFDLVSHRVREWFAENGIVDEAPVNAILRLWRPDRFDRSDPVQAEEAVRDGVFAAFARFVAARAKPLAIVMEDAHWVDPSTIELIDAVLTSQAQAPIFFLSVSRPGSHYPWDERSTRDIRLSGLDLDACGEVVSRVGGGRAFEPALVRQIYQVTDGVPLYVEELTRVLIETGQVIEKRGRMVMRGTSAGISMPTSLLDLLTARLDALGAAKELVQVAAVIGRVVSLDELGAIARVDHAQLEAAKDRLIASGHMRAVLNRGKNALEFRHALFQKAAYDSLLKSQRRTLHAHYLKWLDEDPVRRGRVRPERLASHCQAAGLYDEAVRHYRYAGTSALHASASLEAARHLQRAVDLIRDCEESEETRRLGLELQVLLAGAYLAAKGPGAPETKAAYAAAVALSEALPESEWHFPAYWGWWRVSDTFAIMAQRAERLVKVSERMNGAEFKLQARHCRWANSFQMGELCDSMTHARDGLAIYAQAEHGAKGAIYGGHDAKVCALGETALCEWMTGSADAARQTIAEALDWADRLQHPGSTFHALDIAAMLRCHLRDTDGVKDVAAQLRCLSETHENEEYAAKATIYEAARLMELGEPQRAHDQLLRGLAIMRDIGTPEDFPVFYALLAQCRRGLGDHKGALAALDEGRSVIDLQGVSYWEAELERQAAETLIARKAAVSEITYCLDAAWDIASAQGAHALALRTAMTRARFTPETDAIDRLRDTLDLVVKGGATADTEDAQALL